MAAEAAAQASAAFPALGADCCVAAQGSELLEMECVLAPEGTPHGSTEAAGLAPNDGQWSEVLAGAVCPPQGLVWLAEADGPQGSAFWATGPELGRASIKSNRVVCCGWAPGSFFFGTLTVSLRLSSRAICSLRSSPRLRRSSCSATSLLMASASCSCSSSSPLVWGRACSSSEDTRGEVEPW